MPVFNGARWLPAAIKSIQEQTLADFEFVIVDDGSTDETGDILLRNADEDRRIRVQSQEHIGITAALNRGCNVAQCRFIARMDADDIAHPERLRKQVAYLEGHPEIGAIGTWARVIDEGERETGELTPATEPAALRAYLLKQNPFVHSSMMISADLLRRVGAYRRALEGAEDYDLWLRISERAKLANLPEFLMSYRRYATSADRAAGLRRLFAARLARISATERRALRPDIFEKLEHPASLSALEGIEALRPTVDLYGVLAGATDRPFAARDLHVFGRSGLNHAERKAAQSWLQELLKKQKRGKITVATLFWMLYLHPARGISLIWSVLSGK
jgi:glycosyltransferase involved in cell wall biosynthesis